jgi:hypothetical protein
VRAYYNRQYIKKVIARKLKGISETKDAVLWSVDSTNKTCYVKIQGTEKLIKAYYPEGWQVTPFWLKPRAPVRILHRGGSRGKVEVIGIGQTTPTLVTSVPIPPEEDVVLSGCEVVEIPNDPQMAVMVLVGTFQINTVQYDLLPIAMSDTSNFFLGMGGYIDTIAAVVTINTAPTPPQKRYDRIVIGEDSVVEVVEGVAAEDPLIPAIPDDHISLGTVLVIGNRTVIRSFDINALLTDILPQQLVVTIADDELAWGEMSTTIVVQVLGQYGNSIVTEYPGWYITIEFLSGNGTLYTDEEGSSTTIIGSHSGGEVPLGDRCTFLYTRDGLVSDVSPVFIITLETNHVVTNNATITLLDAVGDPML